MTKVHRYGRGKFQPHENYIKYMKAIVDHPNYSGIQNARGPDGRINWQVSSGKTTSFYRDYLARFKWWVEKADSLKLPGTRNSHDRFSITARKIHPTGIRPCRLCGVGRDVGYFYLNKNFAKKLNLLTGSDLFKEKMGIDEVLNIFFKKNFDRQFLVNCFPDRKLKLTDTAPEIVKKFRECNYLPSKLLSPGFMCNPPDRLDGFHDYGICCRKISDPGRSDENMQKYIRDRRAFEWWASGNWKAADTLYNLAGPGKCEFCAKEVEKLSPDHVGPLSCGFKHEIFFRPLCTNCNSARNRKLSLIDIKLIEKYESQNKKTLACWQIDFLWQQGKKVVKTDAQAELLGTLLRSLQDYYLRLLYDIHNEGGSYLLMPLLPHSYSHKEYEFIDLDRSKFTFSGVKETSKITTGTLSQEARMIRIAFDELKNYASSALERRKRKDLESSEAALVKNKILDSVRKSKNLKEFQTWSLAMDQKDPLKVEESIKLLISNPKYLSETTAHESLFFIMQKYFELLGNRALILLRG